MTTFLKLLKYPVIAISVVLIITAFLIGRMANFNAGIVMVYLIAVVMISFVVLPVNKITKIYRLLVVVGAVVYCAIMLFLYLYKPVPTDNTEQAVIVLGCAVVGDRPSNTMYARTYKAYSYYTENPDVYLVVSGGQGPQENSTEAKAMQMILLDLGVPSDKIILEEQATSTAENFAFSKALLDEKFGDNYKAAYVTNDFHCYRAGKIGKKAGFNNLCGLSAETPQSAALVCYLREVLAVVKLWVFGA